MPSSHNGHISITGVSKYYGRHKALDDVSLEIPPGTVTRDSRPFRLGQVHAAAHHKSPRTGR